MCPELCLQCKWRVVQTWEYTRLCECYNLPQTLTNVVTGTPVKIHSCFDHITTKNVDEECGRNRKLPFLDIQYFICFMETNIVSLILQINFVDFVSYGSYCITNNLIVCTLYEYLHEPNKDY